MIVYEFAIVAILVAFIISKYLPKYGREFFWIFTCLVLALLLGLRDYTTAGVDMIRYERTYETLRGTSFESAYAMRNGENLLFFITCYLFSTIGLNFQLFILLVGLFSVGGTFYLYYKYSTHDLLCAACFLGLIFPHLFSQVKQCIAISFVAISFILMMKGKKNISYLVALFGVLFHPTAIIIFPIIFMSKIPVNKVMVAMLSLASLLIFILRMQIGYLIVAVYDDEYLGYYDSTGGITGFAVFFLLLTVLYIYMRPNYHIKDSNEHIYTSVLLYILISAMSLLFCASYSFVFTRINTYFMQFVPLALCVVIDSEMWHKRFGTQKIPANILQFVIIYIMISQMFGQLEAHYLNEYQFFWLV